MRARRPTATRAAWILGALPAALFALLGLVACGSGGGGSQPTAAPEVRLGRRLFRETRFAQSFAVRVEGRLLADPLPGGDPAVEVLLTPAGPVPHPYAGRAPSCGACHLSDEAGGVGRRAFCDFALHTPLTDRGDGRATTVRNTPSIRDVALAPAGAALLHFDGEFPTLEDLTTATLLGRSLGWLADERSTAAAHVARVVREDGGGVGDAIEPGGAPYAQVLSGAAGIAPDGALLPEALRIDAATASDDEVVATVARLIALYVTSLSRSPDGAGPRAFRSPYDVFLAKNRLPTAPDPGESDLAYGRRLRAALQVLSMPRDVGAQDGRFSTLAHPFRFAAQERRGLLVFLTEPGGAPPPTKPGESAGIGSCVSCHAPPFFTDSSFHNVGATQVEYDAVHGLGAFSTLSVPGLAARDADPDVFLPPSPAHPAAEGRFASEPRLAEPARADLGLWNVFANAAIPEPQAALHAVVLARTGLPAATTDATLLPETIGWMKTPTLRDLGHTGPYFHGGHVGTLEEAVQHYRASALSSRFGLVRNAAPELPGIDFEVDDLLALVAFLRALDEDP